ncbi:O-antigen ligase family protein [Lachnoclostridium sp. Marseille-P6806]|uniref:O-antigen ligase family protein n=1 Tax=Lachnoclostridium sp. Marseille-P6806 TaxID=2364793 RepID=UPI001031E017|nr:O-antigen ligase family protein [Lachnoclostridium sp. Marseille-P6806]
MIRRIMLEKKISLKTACFAFITVLVLLSVWFFGPLGRWRTEHVTGYAVHAQGQDLAGVSKELRPGLDAGSFFLAEGTHLEALRFYAAEWNELPYVMAVLYEVGADGKSSVIAKEFVSEPPVMPGWVTVPADVDTVPGTQYYVMLTAVTDRQKALASASPEERAEESAAAEAPALPESFRVGLGVPVEESAGIQASIYRSYMVSDSGEEQRASLSDTVLDGYLMLMSFTWKEKPGPFFSAALLLTAVLLGAAAAALTELLFRFRPTWNIFTTPRRFLRAVLTPLLAAAGLAACIAVWPMRLFDDRAADNLLYLCGIVITVLAALYALWHRPAEQAVRDSRKRTQAPRLAGELRCGMETLMVALVIQYGCDYMNALSDYEHMLFERRMAAAFLLMLLFSWSWERLLRKWIGAWLFCAAPTGMFWYFTHAAGLQGEDSDIQRAALRAGILVLILAVPVLLLLAGDLAGAAARGRCGGKLRLCLWYALPAAALLAALVLRRNTRWWPVLFAVAFVMLFVRYCFREDRARWFRIVSGGVCLQFVVMVVYCMAHRLFLSFIFTRFAMNFHTVTITAEYLTLVEAVVMGRFLTALRRAEGEPFRRALALCWKETALFATASVYLLFTMSRTGVIAVLVMAMVLLPAASLGRRRMQGGGSVRGGAARGAAIPGATVPGPAAMFCRRLAVFLSAMICSVLLAFPAVFTMQRILSTVNGSPRTFAIEKYPDAVLRGRHWDSMYYMCIERFAQVFGSKMLGLEEGSYDYYKGREIPVEETIGPDLNEGYLGKFSSPPPGLFLPKSRVTVRAAALLASAGGENGGARLSHEAEDDGAAGGEGVPPGAEAEDRDDYSNGRTAIWRAYLAELNMTGHDTMNAELEDGEPAVHAHNTFLQAAYDHGIPVGILFAAVLLLTFIRGAIYYSYGKDRGDPDGLLPMAAAVGFAMAGMVEWVFQFSNPLTMLLLFTAAPLLVRDGSGEKQSAGNEEESSGGNSFA